MKAILFILIAFSTLVASLTRSGEIVNDGSTGLAWQDDATVKTTTGNWKLAIDYCEDELTLGGYSDWRLPNKKELLSIVDREQYNPALSDVFQNLSSSTFWSSTSYAYYSRKAWYVSFYDGHSDGSGKGNYKSVLCVRGGQFDDLEPAIVVPPPIIEESGNPDAVYRFTVDLNETLNAGEYVAVNFDDQNGSWFEQSDAGGHIELNSTNGTNWSVDRTLNKPGLRSFRAGIFNADGVLQGEYSDYTTCTLDSCIEEVVSFSDFGNPQLSGSGSQLFSGVDLSNGNLHLSNVDMSVPSKGPDFTLMRSYNSNSGLWSFNLDTNITFIPNPYAPEIYNRQVEIGPREDGRIQSYYKDMDKKWYALSPGNFEKLIEESDGSFTLYTQGNLLYKFAKPTQSASGRLLSIQDRDGNALSFTHTSNVITGATDAAGRAYTITRDANGKITRVTDFTQRYVEYTYNADKMITNYKNPRGLDTKYTYAGTKLISVKDPKDNTLRQYAYFTTGTYDDYVKFITFADGNQFEYVYTSTATVVKRPSTNGKNNNVGFTHDAKRTKVLERIDAQNYGDYKTKMQYKTTQDRQRIAEFGLVEKTTKPSLAETTMSYYDDGRGNPATITQPLIRITALTYADEITNQPNLTPMSHHYKPGIITPVKYEDFTTSGKAKKVTNELGNHTSQVYDTSGQLTSFTDAKTNSASVTYYSTGQVKRVTNAKGYYTENTYDSLGRVTVMKNPRGFNTYYTYDKNGNVLTTTDAKNGVTTYTYDNSDNLTTVEDPRGNTTTFAYDTSNRKISESYKIGTTTYTKSYTYDALSRVHKVTNESSNVSEVQFDERGQTLKTLNPLLHTTTYTYDANGNVLTVTDAEGRTITNEYDALDRKTKVTDSLGYYEAYTYNTKGYLASKRDKKGLMTYYTYDDLGQLIQIDDPDNGTTTASYDANGNLASTTDRKNQTVNYTYDELNRLTKQKDSLNREWSFTYDENGNMLTQTFPSAKVNSYTYDQLDRVTQVAYHDGQTVTYTYDANGNRTRMVDSSGTTDYTYDELNRLTNVTNSFGVSVGYTYHPTGTLKELIYPDSKKVTYAYDIADRLISVTDWLGDTTHYTKDDTGLTTDITYGNGATVKQTYDLAGRLKTLLNKQNNGTTISSHDMTLDPLGNPITIAADLPLIPSNLGRHADMLYDSSNRLTKVNNFDVTQDADGRTTEDLTHDELLEYTYNAQDLITTIHTDSLLSDEFTYNGDGQRMSMTQGSTTTRYVHDITGGDVYSVLAETNTANQIQYAYVYGEGLISQIDGTSHKYYHYDQSGNTIALSNDSGVMTDKYAYEPFGTTTVDGNTYNPFKFVGKYGVMDDANGMHYMRARYYRADMRRFQSIDALAGEVTDPMTLNRYQYVSGNPLVGVDPSGYANDCVLKSNEFTVASNIYSYGVIEGSKEYLDWQDNKKIQKYNQLKEAQAKNASKGFKQGYVSTNKAGNYQGMIKEGGSSYAKEAVVQQEELRASRKAGGNVKTNGSTISKISKFGKAAGAIGIGIIAGFEALTTGKNIGQIAATDSDIYTKGGRISADISMMTFRGLVKTGTGLVGALNWVNGKTFNRGNPIVNDVQEYIDRINAGADELYSGDNYYKVMGGK